MYRHRKFILFISIGRKSINLVSRQILHACCYLQLALLSLHSCVVIAE